MVALLSAGKLLYSCFKYNSLVWKSSFEFLVFSFWLKKTGNWVSLVLSFWFLVFSWGDSTCVPKLCKKQLYSNVFAKA
jgi:hypothetical protein